ncbi:MAG TPA: bile acid:sodium symporter [Rhizomicrobium sp.]|nr:bile acid:sodium symporter [Rhizomicrobium sp.]
MGKRRYHNGDDDPTGSTFQSWKTLISRQARFVPVSGEADDQTFWPGRSPSDEIAVVFCGSKKSLTSGLPLAQVLFAGSTGFSMIVLPIMLYNQIQLLLGAVLADDMPPRQIA